MLYRLLRHLHPELYHFCIVFGRWSKTQHNAFSLFPVMQKFLMLGLHTHKDDVMRCLLIAIGFFMLLTGCTPNYYQPTVNSWRGGNVTSLVQKWGQPNTKIENPDGTSIYIYRTESYGKVKLPEPTQVGVANRGGRPVIVTTNPNYRGRRSLSLTCLSIFEANSAGNIISTQVRGNGCYGSRVFARDLMNQYNQPAP
jgi:hypothetical protein